MKPQVGVPNAGFYSLRLIRGGIRVGVRIWFGPPIFDGEELDRCHRWNVEIDGKTTRPVVDAEGNKTGQRELLDPFEVWPFACGHPISQKEFDFLAKRRGWAVEHEPTHPAARPREPINLRKLAPGW